MGLLTHNFTKVSLVAVALRMCTLILSVSASATREPYIPPDINIMTAETRCWYFTGVANAEKDLDQFTSLAQLIEQGDSGYKIGMRGQINALLEVTLDANVNLKTLVPILGSLVDNLVEWTEPPISSWRKLKLKGVLWYLDGKRDDKSFYLFNGGGLWCLKRGQILRNGSSTHASRIAGEFDDLQDKIFLARDNLDDAAQIYVKGVTQLIQLAKDAGTNAEKMHKIAEEMQKSGASRRQPILDSGDAAVSAVKREMGKFN